MTAPLPGLLTSLARPAVALCREAPVWGRVLAAGQGRGRGPVAAFLPAYGPEGAALLRIWRMAGAIRAFGWRSLVLPPRLTLAQRRRILGALSPDVVVMQGARHALNRPALYPGVPIVFDMDDADFHLAHLAGPVCRAMPQVAAVSAGSVYVADWCRAAGAPLARVIWTGAPVSARRPAGQGRPVLAWAQTRPMTYLREADLVRRVTARIAARRREEGREAVTLRLFDRRSGDDPAFAESFRAPGLAVDWRPALPYGRFLEALGDASVGLAPLCPETPFSRGKSFGKVLAYLDARVPVIGSDACEHGAFFTPAMATISNDEEAWVEAACRLLDDPGLRRMQADAAFEAFRARLSTEAAARDLAALLSEVVSHAKPRRRRFAT